MPFKPYDVVIVGGGVIGSSTAFHLLRAEAALRLAVVEKDPTYQFASSSLSVANVRIQFSLKENVQISLHAFEALDRFAEEMVVDGEAPDVAFRREGNLFLVDEAGRETAEAALDLQRRLNGPVEWLSPLEIEERFPLYAVKDFAGGTFGPKDGHIDAHALLMGYRRKAKSLGAGLVSGEVKRLEASGGRVTGVALASGERLKAGVVVNCAGAWAAQVALTAGLRLPVEPVKRQIFVLDPATKPPGPLPLTILPSGLYFRTETGGVILLGKSLKDDPVGFDFSWDRERFLELLWPELARIVPVFETLKLLRGWAGLYAVNSLDGNAILGEWPDLKGLYLANGFSGHGLQQAPAVGRYIAELILKKEPALDLSVFSPQRILDNRPLSEAGLV